MTLTRANQHDYCLKKPFSVKDCTYVCNHQGIVFSPINTETLLCDEAVITFLGHLERDYDTNKVLASFWDKQPTYAKEVIDKLLVMRVIQLRE